MDILEIKPMEGIGQVKLGMKRDEVYRVLEKKGDYNASIEWINDYHIEYNRDDIVVFIEIAYTFSDTHFVLFKGVDVFRTEAKLLVSFISEYGNYDDTNWELGYSYSFPALGIGLWRPSIFEYEMVYDPDFREMSEENQIDEMRHLYFEAVCVFVKDYYKRNED